MARFSYPSRTSTPGVFRAPSREASRRRRRLDVLRTATEGTTGGIWNVAIDWDADGFDAADDVTGRALERAGLTADYGRDQTRELSPIAAGAGGLELDNASKDYSPDNVDSPLYGKVLPARPVRFQMRLDGTTHTLFTGFGDGYDVKPARGERSVDISALDAVAKLKGAKATTQLHAGIRTGTAIGYVLDAIDWPDELRDLDAGATVARWWWAENEDAFEAIQKLVQSEGPPAMLTSDEQGRIVFRDRHHRLLGAAATGVQQTFTDESTGEPSFTGLTYDHGWSDIVNSVSVKVEEIDPAPAIETVWESADLRTIEASSTLPITITLDNPITDPDVAFATPSGSVTSEIVQASGQTLTLKLTSGATSASVRDIAVVGRPVAARRTYTILVEDDASIAAYGLRSLEYEVPWAGVNDAGAVAQLVLDASAQRRPIVTITLRSDTGQTSTRLVEQLSRDLSDRVHVREPQTCVDHDFHIERIEHRVLGAGLVLETTFGMERALLQSADVFRFDDDAHGFDDGVFASVALTDPETLFVFDVDGQGFDDGVFAT